MKDLLKYFVKWFTGTYEDIVVTKSLTGVPLAILNKNHVLQQTKEGIKASHMVLRCEFAPLPNEQVIVDAVNGHYDNILSSDLKARMTRLYKEVTRRYGE